jgi:polyprenyl P-hydroxybenzoate/phenylacrylic acid decarboxylase-like protein
MTPRLPLVVGISGSSGPQYGIRLLRALREIGSHEVHLVLSRGAEATIRLEAGMNPDDVRALADHSHDPANMAASISSGSFRTAGMAICPCSMRTLAAIAVGLSDSLLVRAADVCLKERRRLVLVPRETPLNLIHLRNMVTVTEAGAIVLPPAPAFYHRPKAIDDLVDQTVGKILDQLGVEHRLFQRWAGATSATVERGPDARRHDTREDRERGSDHVER